MRPLCACGCGKEVNLSVYTNNRLGIKKGQPNRFICGHSRKGKHFSIKTKEKMSLDRKIPLKKGFQKLNNNLAYIIGVIYGDGYTCYIPKSHNYFIGLEVIDKDFALKFKKELEKWTNRNIYFGKHYRKYTHTTQYENKFNNSSISYKVVLNSKEATAFIKMNKTRILKEIKESNDNNLKISFLRGFIDSEGSISGHYIKIANKNKDILIDVQTMLSSIGINNARLYKHCKNGYEGYDLVFWGKSKFKTFIKKIGFTIKRKQTKLKERIEYKRKPTKKTVKINNLIPEMIRLRNKGTSYEKISEVLNVGYVSIQSRAKDNWIPKTNEIINYK